MQKFLDEYRAMLIKTYTWAQDETKLEKYMASVYGTLTGANTWNHSGDAVTAAWRAIGGKGKPSLKALRELP